MAEQASEYHRGEQDIRDQVSTFHLFMGMTKWGSLHLASLLAFLIIWFCTPGGFMGGLVTAVILTVVGVLVLRDKGGAGH